MPTTMARAAATSRSADPTATGSRSREPWGSRPPAVCGKPAATPVIVTHRLFPPAGVAQMTNWPEQLEGRVMVVAKAPTLLVAVPEGLKLTAPGPLVSEN